MKSKKDSLIGLKAIVVIMLLLAVVGALIKFRFSVNIFWLFFMLVAIKVIVINPIFVRSYARFEDTKSHWWWAIPGVMEWAIFTKNYSRWSTLSGVGFIVSFGITILFIFTDAVVPFTSELTRDQTVLNLVFLSVGLYAVYSLIVSFGYWDMHRYVDDVYYKKTRSGIDRVGSLASKMQVLMYFIPVMRATPMINLLPKMNRVTAVIDNKTDNWSDLK